MLIKPRLLLVLAALALAGCTPMKAQAPASAHTVQAATFACRIDRRADLQYLYYLPRDYTTNNARRWPLLLFLHGAGERGTDVQRVAIHGPLGMAGKGHDFPFIIVGPLCPADERWHNDVLLQLLEQVQARFAVDPTRVYLTGLSMGGYGTWTLGVAYPEKFAAIAPICGGGEIIDAMLASDAKRRALTSLGVWAFHGAKDNVVPPAESERMVGALKRAGVREVKLTVYPEAQHNSWAETYNNPELYDWLLKHQRPRAK